MNLLLLALSTIIAVGFVSWVVVAHWLKVDGPWMGMIVLISTCVAYTALSGRQLVQTPMPSFRASSYLTIFGAFNGIVFYYYALKVTEKNIPVGILSATVSILMVLSVIILDYLINSQTISMKQAAGLALACIAIYMMN